MKMSRVIQVRKIMEVRVHDHITGLENIVKKAVQ